MPEGTPKRRSRYPDAALRAACWPASPFLTPEAPSEDGPFPTEGGSRNGYTGSSMIIEEYIDYS